MQFNHTLLLQKLIELGLTVPELARKIGLKYATLKAKLDNRSQFKTDEIMQICQALGIPIKDCWKFFMEVAA